METVSSEGRETTAFLARVCKGWISLRGESKVFYIILAVAISVITCCLIITPPVRPAVAALEDNAFGLGFRVGDAWNPDAFVASMGQNGLVMRRKIHPDEAEREKMQGKSGRYWAALCSCARGRVFQGSQRALQWLYIQRLLSDGSRR